MLDKRYRQHFVEVLCKRGRKATVVVVVQPGQHLFDAVKAKVADAVKIVTVRSIRFGTLV